MKKLSLLWSILVLMLISTGLYAQEFEKVNSWDTYVPDTTKYSNLYSTGVGLSYSNLTGYGLTLQKRFLDDYTISITGVVFYDSRKEWKDLSKSEVTENFKNILYNVGVSLQRDIFVTNKTKVYGLIGGSYSSDINEFDLKDERNNSVNMYSVGIGCGFQWFLGKHVTSDFQFGYKFQSADKVNGIIPSIEEKTIVAFGFGLIYLF